MLRLVTAIILLVSLLTTTVCIGADSSAATAAAGSDCCPVVVSGGQDSHHPCSTDGGSSHGAHCCDIHTHPQGVTGPLPTLSHPPQESPQRTAVVPHLVPQDFSRIPFIPPRTV
ncbi:hypothetical protein [Trichlorobacter ammonificans]|uniref:Secreted protein n=1 Tax=Trichlorobacter ammonificans TaxID=2916410 RepID=A0ABM9D523_9BACT|nr:hypothetical protein [Trichlorobacter ammonificans]CAH2030255.1 conserved exported protein of unknown function [Trichlorobacter ammonificans]